MANWYTGMGGHRNATPFPHTCNINVAIYVLLQVLSKCFDNIVALRWRFILGAVLVGY